MSVQSREIVDRLRLKMPLFVTLPDPITGEPFTVNRDNLFALLVIDVNNLTFESQTVAALYGEVSRIRAAASRAHQEVEVRFREWKAGKRAQCRKAAEKKATKEEQEDFYRSASDYKERYQEVINLSVMIGLTDDLKKAFEIKSRALYNLSGETFGHNRVQDAGDRMSEMELENLAMAAVQESGSAEAAADFREGRETSASRPATVELASVADSPTEPKPKPKPKPKSKPATKSKNTKKKSTKKARPIGGKK